MPYFQFMKPVAVLIIFFTATILQAQQKFSLEQCIQYAHEHNIQLKMQELSVLSAEQSKMQAKAMFLPTLNASAMQTYSAGRSVDPYTNEFKDSEVSRSDNFSLQSGMVLFQGLRNQYSYKQSAYNLTASLYDLEKARNDLSLNIASAFLQVLLTGEVLKNAQLSLIQSEKQLNRTRSLFDAKAIAENTLLEMEAQYARDDMQVTTSTNQYNMAILTLKQLLEYSESDELLPDAPLIGEPEVKNTLFTVEYIFEQASKSLPQVLAAENRELARQRVAAGGIQERLAAVEARRKEIAEVRERVSAGPARDGDGRVAAWPARGAAGWFSLGGFMFDGEAGARRRCKRCGGLRAEKATGQGRLAENGAQPGAGVLAHWHARRAGFSPRVGLSQQRRNVDASQGRGRQAEVG